MTFDIATDEAIKAAIAAVVTIVVVYVAGWIASQTKRAAKELQNMQNQKVPASIPKILCHFVVLTALIWMLLKTIALSGATPNGKDTALIAAWTWAVLTYLLHVWRGAK